MYRVLVGIVCFFVLGIIWALSSFVLSVAFFATSWLVGKIFGVVLIRDIGFYFLIAFIVCGFVWLFPVKND